MARSTIRLWTFLLVSLLVAPAAVAQAVQINPINPHADAKPTRCINSEKDANIKCDQPNIVLVMADDLDEMVSQWEEAMPLTKALGDSGLVFNNAFSAAPLCCPARAGILTGRYPHNTGTWSNQNEHHGGFQSFITQSEDHGADRNNENYTAAVWLQEAGYKTGIIGKYLNGMPQDHRAPGWTSWQVLVDEEHYLKGYDYYMNDNGTPVYYGNGDDDYSTDVIRERAKTFIDEAEADDDQPFLLYLTPTAPHTGLPPGPDDQNHAWRNASVPDHPSYMENDLSDKPTTLRDNELERTLELNYDPPWPIGNGVPMHVDEYRRAMGTLRALDRLVDGDASVDGVVDKLKTNGEWEDTVFIFTSDHGYSYGSNKTFGKTYPYDHSIRVPWLMAGKDVRQGSEDKFVLNIDLAPTFAELAGIDIPDYVDGRSLVDLLHTSQVPSWRDDFLVQLKSAWQEGGEEEQHCKARKYRYPSFNAVRNRDWSYIESNDDHELFDCGGLFKFPKTTEYELYRMSPPINPDDPPEDRWQLNNLLATAEGRDRYLGEWQQLQTRLSQLRSCDGDSCRR